MKGPLVVIVCACVSLTVTLKLQLGPAELVQVTVVSPTGKKDPEGWSHVTMQLSPEGSVSLLDTGLHKINEGVATEGHPYKYATGIIGM